MARCGAHQANAPYGNDAGCHTLDGESLGHDYGRVGSYDEAEVEDAGRERVAVASIKSQVFSQTKECLSTLEKMTEGPLESV